MPHFIVMPNGEESFLGFQIFIALPTDDVCTVKGLTREMCIYQLKSRIELKAGIPADIFNLFFMNSQLSEQETLKSCHLKNGCIVRVKVESNWIGLFEACWRGDIYDVFENGVQFLDASKFEGYNIHLWNKLVIHRASCALFIACHRGYLGLILELISHGATDINAKTVFGRTALHVAAYQGFVGCVSLLLSEGAICNQIDINGKTPLALASENGHVYCERRLWLYQWNLQSFQPRSGTSSVSAETEGRSTKSVSPRLTSRRIVEHSDANNNSDDPGTKALHFHLPRVANTEDKQQQRRTKSHETALTASRSPLPLVQIAEKYKKELQEYNERTPSLPQVQDRLKGGGEGRKDNAEEFVDEEKAWKDELETVRAAKVTANEHNHTNHETKNEIAQGVAKTARDFIDDANDVRCPDKETLDQTQETGHEDRDSIRPNSAKTEGIRKLDVLMSKSGEKYDKGRDFKREETFSKDLEREEKDFDKQETERVQLAVQDYTRRKPAQTFEHWLEMKRTQAKNRPCTAPAEKSKLGKSIDAESFKKWLNSKRHNRSHTIPESSATPRKTFISSGGLTFDRWLENKTSKRPISAVNKLTDNGSMVSTKVRGQVLSGKSFELWLAEKKKALSSHKEEGHEEEDGGKCGPKSGKSFDVWLQDKRSQKQIELIQKLTEEREERKRRDLEQLSKWLNPHYKTYDDWLAIKNQEAILERVKAQNEPAHELGITAEEKEKDAKLVFDIWQTMKALQELSEEEKKYHEMKAKWTAKEKERDQLRRLNNINQINKNNSLALKRV